MFVKFMDCLKVVVFFLFTPFVHSGYHSLMTTYTGTRGAAAGTPEFFAVTTLDGQQIDYYDSITQKLIPRQDWMQEFVSKEMWEQDTEIRHHVHQIYRDNIPVLMRRFNQTHGVHAYQRIYGCWWDDETGDSHGLDEYGYDGQDFVLLDVKEGRYITPVPQGLITVQKWNNNTERIEMLQQYYKHECVQSLKIFLKAKKADSESRAPEVFLLQRDSSSPVLCLATGFYPAGLTLTWLRDEQEPYEDVDLGETLQNEDGTFQKTVILDVPADDWRKHQYSCVVEHMGKTIQKILTEDQIKSNRSNTYIIMFACVALGILVIPGVLVTCIVAQRKHKSYHAVCQNEESYIDKNE